MTDVQNSLDAPVSLWPLLAIPLFLCLLPPLIMILHHVTTDPVARAFAPPALWPLMALYTLLVGSLPPVRQPVRVIKVLEYDDPISTTTWKRPDPPLDGAEDPPH